jgi:hypothetical protein
MMQSWMPRQSIRLNRIKFPQLIRDLRLRHHWLWLVSNRTPLYLLYPSTDIVHVDVARKPQPSGVAPRFQCVFIWNNHASIKNGDRRAETWFNSRYFLQSVVHDLSSRLKRDLKFAGVKTLAEGNRVIRTRPFQFSRVASGYTFARGTNTALILRVHVDSGNLPDVALKHAASHDRPGDAIVRASVLSKEEKRIWTGIVAEEIAQRERQVPSAQLWVSKHFGKQPGYFAPILGMLIRRAFVFRHGQTRLDVHRQIARPLAGIVKGTQVFLPEQVLPESLSTRLMRSERVVRDSRNETFLSIRLPSLPIRSESPDSIQSGNLQATPASRNIPGYRSNVRMGFKGDFLRSLFRNSLIRSIHRRLVNNFLKDSFEIDRRVSSQFAESVPFAHPAQEPNRSPSIKAATSEGRAQYSALPSVETVQANAILPRNIGSSIQERAADTRSRSVVVNPMRQRLDDMVPRRETKPQQGYGQGQGTRSSRISPLGFDRVSPKGNPDVNSEQHVLRVTRYVSYDSPDAQRFESTPGSSRSVYGTICFTSSFHRHSSSRLFADTTAFRKRFINAAQSLIHRETESWKQTITPARTLAPNRKHSESGVSGESGKPTVPGGNSEWLVHRQTERVQTVVTGDTTVFRNDSASTQGNPFGMENVPSRIESNVSMSGSSSSTDAIAEKVLAQLVKRIGRRQLNGFADLIYERLVSRMKIEKERMGVR